ncbi:PIN domain-like protein [Entophlyctis helioformis]|nr:PIN domain-like protein [Entophlyctis helioformis]
MGIGGLLPFLKSIQRPVQLRDYAGQTIGVDGYVWLHRGANQCAPELVFGIPTRKYVQYFLDMVRLLMNHNITPIIVFDGGRLPSKLRTEEDRHQKRAEARAKYEEHLQKGDREKANAALKGIVEVTPLMAYEVIKELRKLDVEFYVAPYEADAQLAFFDRIGVTTATITEDSDLLTYGCSRVIYKLKFDSKPIEIRRDDIFTIKDLRHWNMTKFREMCILSGCDYLASPEGIGLAKAKKALLNTRAESVLKNWESFPNMPGNAKLVKGYRKKFMLANYTFLHQRVYDPSLGRLVPLHPFPPDMEISDELSFVIGS